MTTEAMSVSKPVSVSSWGELRGERKVPGVLRVLVAGQHVGAIECGEDGGWVAQVHGLRPYRPTEHETAAGGVRAIQRSSWARKLGARAASAVYWSDRATRLAAKAPRKAER